MKVKKIPEIVKVLAVLVLLVVPLTLANESFVEKKNPTEINKVVIDQKNTKIAKGLPEPLMVQVLQTTYGQIPLVPPEKPSEMSKESKTTTMDEITGPIVLGSGWALSGEASYLMSVGFEEGKTPIDSEADGGLVLFNSIDDLRLFELERIRSEGTELIFEVLEYNVDTHMTAPVGTLTVASTPEQNLSMWGGTLDINSGASTGFYYVEFATIEFDGETPAGP